jgi:hypothetical protein
MATTFELFGEKFTAALTPTTSAVIAAESLAATVILPGAPPLAASAVASTDCVYASTLPRLVLMAAAPPPARVQHDGQVLTVPLLVGERFVGALTFERSPGVPFEPETIELLEHVSSVIGSVLEEKRRNDRWIIFKIADSLRLQLTRLFGPGHLVRKLLVAAIVAVALFLTFAYTTYRVDADARIEGLVRRAVVAPYDGYVKEANARAGDTVKEGDVLATLEDRDLLLDRLKWVTERQQHLFEYDKALATRQPAAINVIRAQVEQADAQIKLLDEQLSRIKLRAAISGGVRASAMKLQAVQRTREPVTGVTRCR